MNIKRNHSFKFIAIRLVDNFTAPLLIMSLILELKAINNRWNPKQLEYKPSEDMRDGNH
jgi:hypothetical protein